MTSYPFGRARRIEFRVASAASVRSDRHHDLLAGERRSSAGHHRHDRSAKRCSSGTHRRPTCSTPRSSAPRVRCRASATGSVAPTVGTLTFAGLLTDYRRYFMPVPFYTIAVRAMHYGRYGRDAQDPHLSARWLSMAGQGYDVASTATTAWPRRPARASCSTGHRQPDVRRQHRAALPADATLRRGPRRTARSRGGGALCRRRYRLNAGSSRGSRRIA